MSPRQQHYRCKNFFVSECAVSTALGFVIITGILVSAFCIFVAIQVPQMTKVSEAEHAAEVPQEFAAIDSAIDMAILRGGSSGSGCRLDMMPDSVPVIGVHASAGMPVFNNSTEKFCFMACAPNASTSKSNTYWNSTAVYFPDDNYSKCHVVAQDYGAELELEFSEGDMIYSGGQEELSGSFQCNKFEVTGTGTTLYTANLIIYAREITIGPGAVITADGRGLSGGIQDHNGKGDGAGQNNAENNSAGGGGAGHGGVGGAGGANYTNASGGAGGIIYESPTDDKTALAGSGGGGGSTGAFGAGGSQIIAGEAGNGGGYIFLHAPIINIAGTLSVNGNSGGNGGGGSTLSAGGGGGGGSGGCILLKGDYVTVSGSLYANGGHGGDGGSSNVEPGGGGGGGAGGLIKIFHDSDLDSLNHYFVTGGKGGDRGKAVNGTKNGFDGEPGCNTSSWIPYTQQVCYYATGYLESEVNDTIDSLVCYGNMTWNATTDADTDIILKVRSSFNKSMDENYTLDWDDCPPVINGTDISDLPSVSDGHQYIQWQATFLTFDLAKTPVLHWVNISYEYGIPFIVNTSGCIRYSSHYSGLRNFKLIYAHGAMIKNQTEGVLMVSDPPIIIRNISTSEPGKFNYTKLIITAINLTGDAEPTTGEFVTITPYGTNSELITGGLYYKNFTINISTDYPNVWEKWFTDTCEDAGLINGTDPGNYNIARGGNHLQISFCGDETRPIKIWLKSAEAGIAMKGDG